MDKCFGCHDSRVSIDFSADSEAVNLAIGYAEETDTAAMLDAMLTIFFYRFLLLFQRLFIFNQRLAISLIISSYCPSFEEFFLFLLNSSLCFWTSSFIR